MPVAKRVSAYSPARRTPAPSTRARSLCSRRRRSAWVARVLTFSVSGSSARQTCSKASASCSSPKASTASRSALRASRVMKQRSRVESSSESFCSASCASTCLGSRSDSVTWRMGGLSWKPSPCSENGRSLDRPRGARSEPDTKRADRGALDRNAVEQHQKTGLEAHGDRTHEDQLHPWRDGRVALDGLPAFDVVIPGRLRDQRVAVSNGAGGPTDTDLGSKHEAFRQLHVPATVHESLPVVPAHEDRVILVASGRILDFFA